MRLGLISDIHGNLVALDAILAELDRAGIERTLCLGDLAVLGPQPAEVIDRIRERGIQSVCGNTDAWLVPDHPLPVEPPDSIPSRELTAWTAALLGPDRIEYLRRLPLTIEIPIPGAETILGFHATPGSVDDITHAGAPAGAGEWSGFELLCCGHTHVQAMWRVGEQRWLNPGSVGLPGVGPGVPDLPRNRDVSWAEFAIVDIDAQRTTVTMHRLALDLDRLSDALRASGMPHQDWWLSLWRN